MLTIRDHGVDDYAELADMDASNVGVLTQDDRDCIQQLGDYLVSADAWQRFAIAAVVVLPSPIAVNTSRSTAVFSASVWWYAFMALKKRSGVGCCGGMAVAIDISPVGKGMRSLNQEVNPCISECFDIPNIFLPNANPLLLTSDRREAQHTYRGSIGRTA